jgi:hypothetical protein
MAYNKYSPKKYRARTPIKTFRDLEVYKEATALSVEIFNLKLPEKYRKKKKAMDELTILYDLSKHIPRLVAEGNSKKFDNLQAGMMKLEKAAEISNLIVSKLDFLQAIIENEDFNEQMIDLLKRYERNKMRVLNLKRAWGRTFGRNRSTNNNWKANNKRYNQNNKYGVKKK